MTVVVAYKTKTDCWMAWDSASSNDSSLYEVVTPKAMRIGNGLIGSSGSWYVLNAINALDRVVGWGEVVDLVLGIRDSPQRETLAGVEVLMAWPGKPLTIVDEESAAIELRSPFWAIGSGADYAIGFLAGQKEITPEALKKAVEVAAKYSPFVDKPVHIIHYSKGA
jgi:ATP-dependent protease HslVU (ClpYQ) peptidase subunit